MTFVTVSLWILFAQRENKKKEKKEDLQHFPQRFKQSVTITHFKLAKIKTGVIIVISELKLVK